MCPFFRTDSFVNSGNSYQNASGVKGGSSENNSKRYSTDGWTDWSDTGGDQPKTTSKKADANTDLYKIDPPKTSKLGAKPVGGKTTGGSKGSGANLIDLGGNDNKPKSNSSGWDDPAWDILKD